VKLPRHFSVIAHTHWDREWYWPFERFRMWLGRVVDGVIETLESDPAFRSFTLDGQAIVLEDYLDIRPENEQRLRALLAAGRIETGPSYILPDELLVGAEPLVRNLLMGRRVCERFGAAPASVGYLPDSFGHPAQLPQILDGFGIGSFIFSRGMGDQLDEVGILFRWRAPDGSAVLAIQQLPHYGNFAAIADADAGEQRINSILEQFGEQLERAGVEDLLLCNGSDHHGIQRNLPELCGELSRRFEGREFEISTYSAYVSRIAAAEVPYWSGELIDSRIQNVLRGVNSARLYLKQANERAERQLLALETFAAIGALRRAESFPLPDFNLAWRELLRNHPHDSICGCSCDEVHRDMLVRYESLQRTLGLQAEWELERSQAADAEDRATVFNPLPESRRGLVELPGSEPQIVELEWFATATVELAPASAQEPQQGARIESDEFVLEAPGDGSLTLTDKRSGHRHERLHVLEDEPDMGDLYNFCPVEGAAVWRAERAEARILRAGPTVWELELPVEAERPVGLDAHAWETVALTVITVARLVAGSRRVEFHTTVENAGRDHRLRVSFAAGQVHGAVRAESAFALVHRPLTPPEPKADWTEPPDATQHTAGIVALGALALITKGLPEYEARPGSEGAELLVTLLRCVGVISKPSKAIVTRPMGAGPATPTPEGQCLGRHHAEYALLPDAGQLDDLELLRASQDYRRGLVAFAGTAVSFEAPIAVTGDVVFSCLKGAEDGDGVILRCFNPTGATVTASVTGTASVSRARLDETGEQPAPGGIVELAPYQIATLRLRAGDARS
jgi:mannosylglycerate hydrolase